MATRTISLPLDEQLVKRIRDADPARRSDSEAVERALGIYLGDRAVEAAQAAGTLEEADAERLAVKELHAMRRERHAA